MSDDIINQAISEAVATPVETAQPIETPEATNETIPSEATEPEDVPFPKKAVNALSRRDKQIGKLQAQLAADRAELAKFREQTAKQASTPPNESDYDNYGELLKAQHRHEWQQEQATKELQQKEQYTAQQEQKWFDQRTQVVVSKAEQRMAETPEMRQVFAEYVDVLNDIPPQIERMFYEADDPDLAIYALAKEGRLEEVLSLPPARIAIEIGRAEIRGEAMLKKKQITKTPAPIEGLKGTGGSSKTLNSMNSKELLSWLKT